MAKARRNQGDLLTRNPDATLTLPASTYDEFELHLDTPEKMLLYAFLERSILDYVGEAIVPMHIRRSARAWFLSPSTAPFSFLWVIEHLSSDPSYFKEGIEDMLLGQMLGHRRPIKGIHFC